jgi:hypothetical protein
MFFNVRYMLLLTREARQLLQQARLCKRVTVNVELSNYQADRGLDSSNDARSKTTSSSTNQLEVHDLGVANIVGLRIMAKARPVFRRVCRQTELCN